MAAWAPPWVRPSRKAYRGCGGRWSVRPFASRPGEPLRGRLQRWVGSVGAGDWNGRFAGGDDASGRERPLIDDLGAGQDSITPRVSLGVWLRGERERQGIGLDAVEEATRIRAGQLRAIEEDRLDDLPGEAYARGFVRSYAEQLGCDPATAADRFNRQWHQTHADSAADDLLRYPYVAAAQRGRDRLLWAMLALVAILLAASAALVLHGRRSDPAVRAVGELGHPRSGGMTSPPNVAFSHTRARVAATVRHPTHAGLVVRAITGPCWVEAHESGQTGPLLAMKTLERGQSLRLGSARIWIRLGDPLAASVMLNGRRVPLPQTANPTNLIVSRHGAAVA